MKLPNFLTTVTTLSKIIALVLFILLPFIGFYLGTKYKNISNPLPLELNTSNIKSLKGYSSHTLDGTNLTFSIPETYKETTDNKTSGMQAHVKPSLNFLKSAIIPAFNSSKEFLYATVEERLSVYIIKTNVSPSQWLKENVTLQGQSFDPKDTKEIEINGRTVTVAYTSCCGGYSPTYIIQYQNVNRENILIIFVGNAFMQSKDGINRGYGNYFLDDVLHSVN